MKKKLTIKNGQITYKTAKKVVKSTDAYSSYINYATGTHHISKKNLLSREEFNTAMAGQKARGRKTSGKIIAELQATEGYTQKEIRSRWHASQKLGTTLSKKQFIARGEYKSVDKLASNLYERLKEEYPGLETWQYSRMIGQEIYGSD